MFGGYDFQEPAFNMGMRMSPGLFVEHYRCYPVAALRRGREQTHAMNYAGKLILPPSALEFLVNRHASSPMLFSVTNPRTSRKTHGGVLEFVAEEGRAYLPDWMIKAVGAAEGEILRVESALLAKGSFVKIQPCSLDFLDITDPKAVLENALRHFSALTQGDTIAIHYNDRQYDLLLLETHPGSEAISIHETDLEVDFAPPPGYEEPVYTKPQKSISASLTPSSAGDSAAPWTPYSGSGKKLSGKLVREASSSKSDLSSASSVLLPSAAQSAEPRAVPIQLPRGKLFFGHRSAVPPSSLP